MEQYAVKGFDVAVVNRGRNGQRIDWQQVKGAGEADFCLIRVLDGLLIDADGEYNCDGAASIGLPFGVYQPFYPQRDARTQARLAAAWVKNAGNVRAAGDFEIAGGVEPEEYLSLARMYVTEFEQLSGQKMTIYTGSWFGSYFLQGAFADRPLWVANPYNTKPSLPKGWKSWTIWQDAWNVSWKGIFDSTVDRNRWNGTLDEMRAWFGVRPDPTPLSLEERVARLEQQARAHGWSV
jgi:GH25 family lysozyme M1 (1,4-beta-N-acetylmuramidase)